jgi:hypothetical protein
MVRVLVMANESVLADAIVSILAEEIDMDVLRTTRHEPDKIDLAIREHHPVVIIIEESSSENENRFITAGDLSKAYDRLRILTLSPENHLLHVCESYQLPVSGMTQLVNLVRDFDRI